MPTPTFPGWSWSFDIDRYLNRIVPPPPWNHVPRPVAHFLGHRKEKPQDLGNLRPIFWAFIGIFCAISVIQVASKHIPAFQDRNVPLIIGSFGAAAVLEFYAIESPLAQPRNAVLGQVLASLVGISMAKLFQLSDRFEDVRWVAGALACAAATALMALTKTVHPPAGATALLAVANQDVTQLGWYLLPVMLLGLALMLAVALLINNLERQFPVYWWTPESLRRDATPDERMMVERKRTLSHEGTEKTDSTLDLEAGGGGGEDGGAGGAGEGDRHKEAHGEGGRRHSRRGHERDHSPATTATTAAASEDNEIIIRPGHVLVPEHLFLRQEEMQYLETLSQRL